MPGRAIDLRDRVRGCLLGGAMGDALGAPIEFLSLAEIRRRYGPAGITRLDRAYGRVGAVTDDTQMTLFTAEGLVRAHVRAASRGICHAPSVVHHAYLRWLATQGEQPPIEIGRDGWLFGVTALHSRRAPGATCLSALRRTTCFGEPACNDSKGCGGVMRVAPVGLVGNTEGGLDRVFDTAAECAGLTHGHPTGRLTAGYLAAVIAAMRDGRGLVDALDAADRVLAARPDHDETARALAKARQAAGEGASAELVAGLGLGWVAEEALAIAVYCVLAEPDPLRALALAANHDGDSDSTAAVTGNILGARHGTCWLPADRLDALELRAEIERLADDLSTVADGSADDDVLWDDYPGW